MEEFNTREMNRHDALQVMLRHVAAIEMASMLKFCSSKRGIEHQLVKHHFKKLTIIQDLMESAAGISDKSTRKLEELPLTAGYAGDNDLTDVPVYLHDDEYTVEDKEALERLSEIGRMAHLPPIEVVDGRIQEGYQLVDEHTLVYTVDPGSPVRSEILERVKPAAMIWRDCAVHPKRYDFYLRSFPFFSGCFSRSMLRNPT